MAEKPRKPFRNDDHPGEYHDGFPETRTDILAAAAAGKWDDFFKQYLAPSWREVVIACRSRNIALTDAEDIYQELMCRLIRDSRFNHDVRSMLIAQNESPDFLANLPGRYLKYRELPLRSARFRSYLKKTIRNLILERLRGRQPQPVQLGDLTWEAMEPWIEESITRSLDRQWLIDCLMEAASRLQAFSQTSSTRGRKRLFDVLYLSTVKNESPGKIASDHGVDRSTIATLLTEARGQFVAILARITGISEKAELKQLLADSVEQLKLALDQVHRDNRD